MNYILALVSIILVQNTAGGDSQNRRNVNDSFDVNIGAGYAVGLDQSSPPNGTSNINLSKKYYSNSMNASVRGPRILSNFTPQIGNPIPEVPKNHAGYKEHYSASSSNIHSYNAPILPTSSDLDEQNLVNFQKILNEVETKKPFSKILQVIKVPAIYEIHFQSDDNQKKVNLDPTGNLFWRNYYENKPNTITHNFDDYSKWVNNAHLQEESGKWLNNVHLQEEHLSKDGEKYYDFSNTPVVSYENLYGSHSPHDKPEGNRALQPTTTHHYSDTKFPNFDSDKDVRINHNSDSFTKPTWINKDNLRNKKHPYAINNFKRHVVYNSRGPSPNGQSLQNEMLDTYVANTKNLAPFKNNQVITENDKPQALHEVPAPFLGKYQQPRPFEIQKQSDSYSKLLPTTSSYKQTKVKFNQLSPTTPKPTFNYKNINGYLNFKSSNLFRKKNIVTKLEPSYKENDNLIYGKKSEQILTPYEINIPVTPGSTIVTVTDRPYNKGKTSQQSIHYSTSMTTNMYSKIPEDINTFNDHYQQVANLRQQSSNRVDQNSEYSVNKNTFNSVDISQKDTNQNNFQYPGSSTNSINMISSEKPEILDNKLNNYYKEVIDIPYQTQKSISIENVISTTPNSGTALEEGTTIATSTISSYEVPYISQPDQRIKKNTDKMAAVTTKQREEVLRRRVFNASYNRYMNNGYLKNSQQSRISKRKSNGPRLDSIIYITRKSID